MQQLLTAEDRKLLLQISPTEIFAGLLATLLKLPSQSQHY